MDRTEEETTNLESTQLRKLSNHGDLGRSNSISIRGTGGSLQDGVTNKED